MYVCKICWAKCIESNFLNLFVFKKFDFWILKEKMALCIIGHPAQLTFVIDIEKKCVYINMKCGDNEQCYKIKTPKKKNAHQEKSKDRIKTHDSVFAQKVGIDKAYLF